MRSLKCKLYVVLHLVYDLFFFKLIKFFVIFFNANVRKADDKESRLNLKLFETNHSSPNNPTLLGETEVPLSQLVNQEEYDINLEITDRFDPDKTTMLIQTKMTFIFSFFAYHQQCYFQAETNYNRLKAKSEKDGKLLEHLNEPFNLFLSAARPAITEENNINPNSNDMEEVLAGNIENAVKNTFKVKSVQWMWFTKLLLVVTLILAFLNMFLKADFINVVIPMYILMITFTTLDQNPASYIHSFLVMIGFTLASDLLWIIFHDSVIISLMKFVI